MSKISVIGAGEVGASCAACIAERDFVNEIVIVDKKQGVAEGKALDLRQSAALKRFDTIVKGVTADYSAISNSDVVVIAAGNSRKPGMERNDLVATNAKIIRDVCQQVANYSPNAVIIVVSNPLDVLCYCALKSSGFPDNRVMGMSGQLDAARYKSFIAETLNISTKDVQALILGGHGKSMVPMPRYTTIGGIPIRNLLDEEKVQAAIHRTGHQGRPAQVPLRRLHAQDQHRRVAAVLERPYRQHEHHWASSPHAGTYRAVQRTDKQIHGTPFRKAGHHWLGAGDRLPR